jgi:membrane-bound lytic murein transglycosylase D
MSTVRGLAWMLTLMLSACQAPTRPIPPEPATPSPSQAPSQSDAESTPATPSATSRTRRKPAPPRLIVPSPPPAAVGAAELFERLRSRFADPPCIEDRVVQRWEKTYGRWPPRLRANLEAILPLLALVLDEVELHRLPSEFVLLPIVESWYRPDAGSARTAYGMWQFTTGTARHHGLRIVPGFDERLAPQASTRAAMRYLAQLHNRFGDWKLADMAFNAGEYRLQRVLARQGSAPWRVSAAAHLPAGLSMTTYEHVAKIQALACLIARPERFGLELPDTERVPLLHAVELAPDIASLDAAATRAGVDAAVLRRLNPAFAQGRIVPAARREIVLPRSAADRFRQASSDAAPAAKPVESATVASSDADRGAREYRVRRGDTLSAIALRHGVTLRQLLQWNRLDVRALLQPGQRLRLEP